MNQHRHRKPKGRTVTTLQFTFMILFGTVGVLCVLAAQLLAGTGRGRHAR